MRRGLPLFVLSQLLLWVTAVTGLYADGPAFDLTGPKVDVHVKRGDVTLPISQAANLLPGDRLWIHPDLPASQSARYVLVVAFLTGSSTPSPSVKRLICCRGTDSGFILICPKVSQPATSWWLPSSAVLPILLL